MPGKHLQAAVLLACALAQGCAFFTGPKAQPAQDGIKVGFVGSFSGDNAGNGDTVLNGLDMALSQINTVGVLGGHKLTILRGDDKSDPATGAQVANDLISQGAVALIGPNSSGIAEQIILNAAKPHGVPMISPSATSPIFSDPAQVDTGGYFFRTVPSDALQGKLLAERAKQRGYKKLAVIHVVNSYGTGLAKVLEDSFGSDNALDVSYPYESDPQKQSAIDYNAVITKAMDFNPDCVVLIAYVADGSNVVNSWLSSGRGKAIPWMFSDATYQKAFIQNVHDQSRMNGFIGTAPATDPTFLNRYRSQYLTTPSYDSGSGYDALALVALAIEEASAATPQAIRDHLRSVSGPDGDKITPDTILDGLAKLRAKGKVNYEGWEGPDDLDEHGDVTTGKYVIWKIDGDTVTDTSEIISP